MTKKKPSTSSFYPKNPIKSIAPLLAGLLDFIS